MNTSPQPPLKLLCLHGYNNHAPSFQHMTAPFIAHLPPSLATFDYLDGPYEIDPQLIPPERGLVKLGFVPPFRAWNNPFPVHWEGSEWEGEIERYRETHERLEEHQEYHYLTGVTKEIGNPLYWCKGMQIRVEEGIECIAHKIRKDGPYDGMLTFSQGSTYFRLFHFVTQQLKPEKYKDIVMPRFVISFSGSVFHEYIHLIGGKVYGPYDYSIRQTHSLHIYGKVDPLYEHSRCNFQMLYTRLSQQQNFTLLIRMNVSILSIAKFENQWEHKLYFWDLKQYKQVFRIARESQEGIIKKEIVHDEGHKVYGRLDTEQVGIVVEFLRAMQNQAKL